MRIQVQHHEVAGRLRFRAPSLYRSRGVGQRIEEALATLGSVDSIRVNERTAGVLLHYDSAIPAEQIIVDIDRALASILPEIVEAQPAPGINGANPLSERLKFRTKPSSLVKRPDSGHRWHALALAEVLEQLQSDPNMGLTVGDVLERLEKFGPNSLGEQEKRSELIIFLEQFKSLPVAMLGVSAVVALLTGGRIDAAVILSVVMINAGIGFYTERQAERTIASLDSMAPKHASVLRDGGVGSVEVENVVPGDVLLLAPGSQVAADARLLSARRLSVDESALTGESLPVDKRPSDSITPDIPLSNRSNMLHMGTVVTGGNAHALVVETGSSTELGKIQALVETTRPPETPLERQLQQLGTQLGILSGAICAGIFVIGILRGQPRLEMLNTAISLAVAAVPEGLPAVATTTLAMGIRDMNKRDVAVRKIEAVETLGSLKYLCLDKTGTLTRNHMSVVAVQQPGKTMLTDQASLHNVEQSDLDINSGAWQQMLKIIALCSDADLEQEVLTGSPTEIALLELAQTNLVDVAALRSEFPRLETRERAEGRPLMSTIHETGQGLLIAVKGRPAEVLERCDSVVTADGVAALDQSMQDEVLAANETMAENALRVLAVAYGNIDTDSARDAENLTWVGLIGLQDPLRPGMRELMADFHQAGIKTLMITGDQSATAYAIANELGLADDGSVEILDSSNLDKVDPELLSGLVKRTDVFSRVSPAHKLEIVQALQQAGEVIAMTGDGINDGPALKAADIGVAMGKGGTDIARSVADVVIKDDNLRTMRLAVRQGRTIYSNIRKMIHYMLSANFSEIEVMLVGIAGGMGSLMNPMQLLWINLVTDIFPGLALSFEPPSDDVMKQQPRPSDAPLISRERLVIMAIESGFISVGTLAAYFFGRRNGGPGLGSTLAFQTLTLAELVHSYACRSETRSIYSGRERPRNPALEKALVGTALLQVATFAVPAVRRVMGNTPMGWRDLLVVGAGATGPMLANELYKELRIRRAQITNPNQVEETNHESEDT